VRQLEGCGDGQRTRLLSELASRMCRRVQVQRLRDVEITVALKQFENEARRAGVAVDEGLYTRVSDLILERARAMFVLLSDVSPSSETTLSCSSDSAPVSFLDAQLSWGKNISSVRLDFSHPMGWRTWAGPEATPEERLQAAHSARMFPIWKAGLARERQDNLAVLASISDELPERERIIRQHLSRLCSAVQWAARAPRPDTDLEETLLSEAQFFNNLLTGSHTGGAGDSRETNPCAGAAK
jgi:hypothetical protein